MVDSSSLAISAALVSNWEQAIRHNKEILKGNPENIEALNRLGFAFSKVGDYKKACQVYGKVLSIDQYNAIAVKNLEKYKQHYKSPKPNGYQTITAISPTLFLEEPGKTKVVALVNVASKSILATLSIGQAVSLFPKRHTIEVRDEKKIYIGALPDDLSYRLKQMIDNGNRYLVFIKSVGKNCTTVFVKELKRGKKSKYQPTFSSRMESSSLSARRDAPAGEEDGAFPDPAEDSDE